MGAMMASGGDYPERLGQPVCLYYMKTGMCKFGASCKYHHPSQGGGSTMPTTLNIYGYPLRSGEKECCYYVKTGQCKFGVICKFHHPQPAGVQFAAPMPGHGPGPMSAPAAGIYPTVQPNQQNGVPSGNWPVARPTMLPGSYVPSTYGPMLPLPQGMVSVPGWSSYPALVSPAASVSTQPSGGSSPVYGVTQLSPQAPADTYVLPLSGSSPISDYFADLPQEVFMDIFIRLPLKSIGRSRCVSMPWLSLLTSYEFTKAHLAHHTQLAQEQKLLLCSSSHSLFSLALHLGGNHLRKLEFFDKEVFALMGSCNGLVFVGSWVINCLTKEYAIVPGSPFPLCPHLCFIKYGFGYDEVSDDYKIVQISQCDYGQFSRGIPNCPEIFVDIYSLKMRSWKRLETPFYGHDILNYSSCVFINGAIHWIGVKSVFTQKQSPVIGAFNLCDEKFTEILGPAFVNDRSNYWWSKLMVIDGCLGIVPNQHADEKSEIWLMKSYSSVDSWTKLVIDFKPLCFHQGKILFHDGWPRVLKRYCLKDGRVEVCLAEDDDTPGFDDDTHGFDVEIITYTESLVSPHFNHS